jgi:predicted RNase H-like HicB family nuclease
MVMKVLTVQVELATQEDGLWRATAPGLQGCWVDAPTMEQAITEIQEVVAMYVDFLEERGEALPDSLRPEAGKSFKAAIPVDVAAYTFTRPARRHSKSVSR